MKDYIVATKSGKIRGYERNGILEYLIELVQHSGPPLSAPAAEGTGW